MHMEGFSHQDSISFAASFSLSLIATLASIIRVWGCFLPPSPRLWQFGICVVCTVASIGILGVISSKKAEKHIQYERAYNFLLVANDGLVVIFEYEFMLYWNREFSPKIENIYFWMIILLGLYTIGLSVGSLWLSIRSILIILLSMSSGAYLVLSVGYTYRFLSYTPTCRSNNSRYTRMFFLANAILCFLGFFIIGCIIFPSVRSSVGSTLMDSTWICFTVSTILSLRFPILQKPKKTIPNVLFGTHNQDGSVETIMETAPRRRLSSSLHTVNDYPPSCWKEARAGTDLRYSKFKQLPTPYSTNMTTTTSLLPATHQRSDEGNHGLYIQSTELRNERAIPFPQTPAVSLNRCNWQALASVEKVSDQLGTYPLPKYEGDPSDSKTHFDACQPLPMDEMLPSPAPAHLRALALEIDPDWDLCLPTKRREGLNRITREPRFRRKAQYCCKCEKRRKYVSTQYCTCNHKRCDDCKEPPKSTEDRRKSSQEKDLARRTTPVKMLFEDRNSKGIRTPPLVCVARVAGYFDDEGAQRVKQLDVD